MIYENMVRQASMLSFADVFFILTIMMVFLVPIVLLMTNPGSGGGPVPAGE
jgi:hypothetical protein